MIIPSFDIVKIIGITKKKKIHLKNLKEEISELGLLYSNKC